MRIFEELWPLGCEGRVRSDACIGLFSSTKSMSVLSGDFSTASSHSGLSRRRTGRLAGLAAVRLDPELREPAAG